MKNTLVMVMALTPLTSFSSDFTRRAIDIDALDSRSSKRSDSFSGVYTKPKAAGLIAQRAYSEPINTGESSSAFSSLSGDLEELFIDDKDPDESVKKKFFDVLDECDSVHKSLETLLAKQKKSKKIKGSAVLQLQEKFSGYDKELAQMQMAHPNVLRKWDADVNKVRIEIIGLTLNCLKKICLSFSAECADEVESLNAHLDDLTSRLNDTDESDECKQKARKEKKDAVLSAFMSLAEGNFKETYDAFNYLDSSSVQKTLYDNVSLLNRLQRFFPDDQEYAQKINAVIDYGVNLFYSALECDYNELSDPAINDKNFAEKVAALNNRVVDLRMRFSTRLSQGALAKLDKITTFCTTRPPSSGQKVRKFYVGEDND